MVVWIQNPFDTLPSEGGRKMRYWLLSEAFARAGHRVTLWTSDFSHATKRRRECGAGAVEKWKGGEVEKCDVGATGATSGASATCGLKSPPPLASQGIEVRLVPTLPYSRNVSLARIRSHRAYAAEWMRLAQDTSLPRPDLVVASIPTVSGAEAALSLGRRFGAKVVVDVMDAWPETFERLAPRPLRPLAHALLTPLRRRARRVYRDADLVTGVSERYRELTGRGDYYLAYHGIEVEKWRSGEVEKWRSGDSSSLRSTVPHLHSSTFPHLHSSTFPHLHSSTFPLLHSSTSLVYAGNLGRTYDLATVVKAVEADPRLTLDVAGFGEFRSDCPRVRFHGLLSERDLRTLLESCDVGVVPMAAESWVGVPYKLCDYARAGLKVVSSLGGETSGLLERWQCGATYRAGDAASFAAAVASVASMPSGASRRMCEELFDAGRIYDGYVRRATGLPRPIPLRERPSDGAGADEMV